MWVLTAERGLICCFLCYFPGCGVLVQVCGEEGYGTSWRWQRQRRRQIQGQGWEDGAEGPGEAVGAAALRRALFARSLVGQCCIPTVTRGGHYAQGVPRVYNKVAVVEADPRGCGVGLGSAREQGVETGPEALACVQRGLAFRGKAGHEGRTG